MGGKSSSSTATTTSNTTTNTSGSATGVVGDVLQGESITINENVPDNVIDIFKQLVALSENTINLAAEAGGKAIDTISSVTTTAAQPDVALVQGYQKQVYYAIGAIAIVGLIVLFKR